MPREEDGDILEGDADAEDDAEEAEEQGKASSRGASASKVDGVPRPEGKRARDQTPRSRWSQYESRLACKAQPSRDATSNEDPSGRAKPSRRPCETNLLKALANTFGADRRRRTR